MDFESKYNTKIPAVKRLMREACELKEATEDYCAHPLNDNLFEWHFTVKGSPGTEFEGGVYHGRIILPTEYPMKPPNIILLTPNGRFEVNKKICLSISGHHPETWQPSWSIRTALLALIAFMPTPGKGTIGSLDYTPEERKVLARKSQQWNCSECGLISNLLGNSSTPISQAESQLIKSVLFKAEGSTSSNERSGEASETAETEPKNEDPSPSSSSQSSQPGPAMEEIHLEHSGGGLRETIADALIAVLVLAISFLLYRRFFLLQ